MLFSDNLHSWFDILMKLFETWTNRLSHTEFLIAFMHPSTYILLSCCRLKDFIILKQIKNFYFMFYVQNYYFEYWCLWFWLLAVLRRSHVGSLSALCSFRHTCFPNEGLICFIYLSVCARGTQCSLTSPMQWYFKICLFTSRTWF